MAGWDEEYVEAVLDVVAAVPPGRATTYGTVAEVLAERLGRGGPRQVGNVLARAGDGVPWWRVVNASGLPPAHHRERALALLRQEGCPLTPDDGRTVRVVLRSAIWWPDDDDADDEADDAAPSAGPPVSPATAGS